MAIVPSDIIRRVRQMLQDTVADYRYTDTDLCDALNMGLAEMRRIRPDFFIGILDDLPTVTTGSLATAIPIEAQYAPALVLFVAGYAELRDDQFATDGRASTLLGRFSTQLTGVP